MIGNVISGLIGGGLLGQIVTLLLPAITAAVQSGTNSNTLNLAHLHQAAAALRTVRQTRTVAPPSEKGDRDGRSNQDCH
jgi:hypothetical protein